MVKQSVLHFLRFDPPSAYNWAERDFFVSMYDIYSKCGFRFKVEVREESYLLIHSGKQKLILKRDIDTNEKFQHLRSHIENFWKIILEERKGENEQD